MIIIGSLYFRQPVSKPASETEGTNFFSDLNPFSTSKPATSSTTLPVNIPNSDEPIIENPNIKLKKVSSMPIAGFGVFKKEKLKNEFGPALRYVERATGNVYQTFADKIDERKFSATVIPRIYEAYLGNNGEAVVMRYLKADDKTIETFVGTLPKELLGADTIENNEIKGLFLPENISEVSMAPDDLKILYFFNIGDGVTGITANLRDNKKTQVFESAFTEWLASWPNTKMITLTTKPSANVPGYLYAFDPNKKELNEILGDINGLTTLTSPSGKLILYGNNNLALNIFHTDTKDSNPLGIKTLPEKCIWSKENKINAFIYCAVPKIIDPAEYPDAWYQGEVSFSDEIWKIDVEKGNATIIADPVSLEGGQEVDGIKLALDENENYLFFVNKKDSYLWELVLK